ncbi:hypothetical protein MGG_10846 [Pyricularia oryzae 70-15]|uniref:Uncharacterized protein n=1 Tax=Pyricularia oryzae (strain 70-15 / ATCC MYA-4617 / FGSC 8958) TaxID=242507 RepID=G4N396_PYRO7|nr:uncharacterized protein MGG_10846 [Pyricularia oryzae 70-15]EHA53441.1 hypothetical protein MGG_10846 [Pyricularia oryzae 70-15]
MSLEDETDNLESILDRIKEGFLEMKTALQDVQDLNTRLRDTYVWCEKMNKECKQSMTTDESWCTETREHRLDMINQSLQDLQRLEEMPHWVFQQWPVLRAHVGSLDESPCISARRRLGIQAHMDEQQRLIDDGVEEIYHLCATIRYKTVETVDMLEQPTEEELKAEELVESAR